MPRVIEKLQAGLMCSESALLTFQALALGTNSRTVVLMRWCGSSVSWILPRLLWLGGGFAAYTFDVVVFLESRMCHRYDALRHVGEATGVQVHDL